MRIITSITFLIIMGAVSGCSFISTKKDIKDIQNEFERQTKKTLDWEYGSKDDRAVQQKIEKALEQKISLDTAVEIALINNPSLQASFEKLGIAKAELVEAGLLENPSFSGSIREPEHEGDTNTEFEVTQNILSLITLPLRKGLVNSQLEQAKYSLGEAMLNLNSEVRNAYYSLQAANQMYAMQQKILKAEEAAAEIAQRQLDAGNINDLALAAQRLSLTKVQMDLKESEVEVKEAKENLGRLMGLTNINKEWDIEESLPFVSKKEPDLKELEAKTRLQNFSLLMAKQQVEIMEDTLRVSRINVLPEINAGFNTEKEPDGSRVEGPVFEVEVPLFNQKQSTVAGSKAQLRQAKELLKAKEDEVISEVRSKYFNLLAAKAKAEIYLKTTLPLHAQLIESLQKHYNFMLVGVYDLLEAKNEESEAYHEFVDALKEYWTLRSELELLIGEKIEYVLADTSTKEAPKSSPKHQNHDSHGGKHEK